MVGELLNLQGRIKFLSKGSKTKRFHTADTLTTQTVGEHSFGVAFLVELMFPFARKELIMAALSHDLAEHCVGDVSSVVKRQFKYIKEAVDAVELQNLINSKFDYERQLSDEEKLILKAADLAEGMLFCIRERTMGSKVVVEIYNNFNTYVKDLGTLPETAFNVIFELRQMWEDANAS